MPIGTTATARVHQSPTGVTTLTIGPEGGPIALAVPGVTDGLAPMFREGFAPPAPEPPPALAGWRMVLLSYRRDLPPVISTEQLAGQVIDYLERDLEQPAVLAGHSLGGMVAQHVAAARPDLVRGLVLSACGSAADDALRAGLDRWERQLRACDWEGFARDAVAVSFTGAERLRRAIAARLQPVDHGPAFVERHLTLSAAAAGHDARPVLDRVAAPTLVAGGTDDPLVSPARVRDLARRIRHAELAIFPGLAHGFPEQARDRFTARLGRFLEERVHG